MAARLLVLWLLVFALAAGAQPKPAPNANQQALELAQRLGREWSIEGLETIAQSRNVDLVAAYERGFRETAFKAPPENAQQPRRVPPGIEAIIVKYYGDAQLGPLLRKLISASRAQYGTRELFDLMYAEWRSGKPRPSTYPIRDAILRTDLAGIEAPLLELLQAMERPDGEDGRAIVRFLAQRRFSPAVPVMIAIQDKAAPNAAVSVSQALLDMRTPEATAAVLKRLAWLRTQPAGAEAASEARLLANAIANLSPEVPVDYVAFRGAIPETLDDNQTSALLAFIQKRKEKQGAAEVLGLLGETKYYPRTLEILIALDSPEIWQRARAEVERLKQLGALNDGQYRYASSVLDGKIADPQKHFAEQKQRERQQEFEARKSALYAQRTAAQKLKRSAPESYLNSYLDYLQAQDRLVQAYPDLPPAAVGLRGEIANEYLALGHFARFKLKRANQAIELYEAGARSGLALAAFAVADTYQFDLRDKAQALARYRGLLEEQRRAPRSGNDLEAGISQFASAWLAHQVDYLATGKTFGGRIRQEECGAIGALLYYGAGGGTQDDYLDLASLYNPFERAYREGADSQELDREAIGQKLQTLPASGFTLLRTAALVSAMPDAESILRYLGKHDPAGFASACLLSMVELIAKPAGAANPMRIAAARFNKEHRIVADKPDPRMASPEQTWRLFIGSLKEGDVETALACLTPAMQNRFRPVFAQPPEKLRAMAESFTGFALTTKTGERMQEAIATRGQRAGMIYFVDVGGAWKISEM